jgi:hypothetical protein
MDLIDVMREIIGTQGLAVLLVICGVVASVKFSQWAFSRKDGPERGMITQWVDRRIQTETTSADFMNRTARFMERAEERDAQFVTLMQQQVANCQGHERQITSLNTHLENQNQTGKQIVDRLDKVVKSVGSDGPGFASIHAHWLDGVDLAETVVETMKKAGMDINADTVGHVLERIKHRAERHSRPREA